MEPLDPRSLRRAFGAYLTGVTVVTALAPDGTPVGFTANSFTSVSLDPPLVLVCPSRGLSSFPVFEAAASFAVNILAEGQETVSNIFAGGKGDRFAQVNWSADAQGCPLIDGAVATFSCAAHDRIDAGDHIILVGRVIGFTTAEARGLGYGAGEYFSLGLERRAETGAKSGRHAVAGAIVEHDGSVLLQETTEGLRLPHIPLAANRGVREALKAHFAQAGVPLDIGQVYSIYEGRTDGTAFTYFIASSMHGTAGGLGRYVPIDRLDQQRFAHAAEAVMLRRFALEHRTRAFGLYLGDDDDGEIHPGMKG